MFNITDDEKLRDAYALLMFMQKDVPASSKKKANVKNLVATVKRCAGMSEEVERMAKYTIDAVLEVCGSFDVEADSFGEAYRKAAENPGKYANLKVWNDGTEAQLRMYSHINCIGEYDVDDAVAALTGKEAKKE